jgi:vitellogenic carboxypeptidase-like protein
LYGLFTENGPFIVSADGRTISENKYTWNKKYNIMYIDNPVGVGFSFTDSPSGYSVSTERDVADNMWTFLQQFYVIFPEFKSTPLFISGESYGGKYTPAIAYRIHENNKKHPQIHVPLKGLSIGDGAMDPITQMTGYSDLLYYTGFADDNERWQMKEIESQIVDQIGGGVCVNP